MREGATPAAFDGPLTGTRVLDLSRVLSGPSCGKALVDLGADVIKIEPPEGDLTRTAQPRVGGLPAYFAQQNCGKRCVSVDLQREAGAALVADLAASCDVLVENFRPRVLDRFGLGYDALRARNPRLVYCSITGYGQDGSMSSRRAYAPVMHAELGLMEFAARRLRGAEPRPEAVSHADLYAGLQATVGILAALVQRDRTGAGQHIDVSMAETMLQATEWTAVELAGGTGDLLHIFGSFNAPVLRLGDGAVVHVPGDPVSSFPAWCIAMQRPELETDDRFATREARHANREAMLEEFQAFAATFSDFEEFEAALGKARLAVGEMRPLSDVGTAAWAHERGALVDVGIEGGDPLRLPRSPFRFSDAEVGTHGRPAWQGAHNREVLRELLGLAEADIEELERDGVLVERRPR
ncbi:MAG TPA: CaiB/BaiF CoA-transferase family protein [Acidimicrobiales bacterium]|nr:CaiB/BaiF CoA-transferase family protein [Acidimicrobiales bacterium]